MVTEWFSGKLLTCFDYALRELWTVLKHLTVSDLEKGL